MLLIHKAAHLPLNRFPSIGVPLPPGERSEAPAPAAGDGGRGDAPPQADASAGRRQSWNTTDTPGVTSPASSSASQFVRRTQPWLWLRNRLDGSGVPWMP